MIVRNAGRGSIVAVALLLLGTAGCKKNLTPQEREAWTARVAEICKCERAECMGRGPTTPPPLAAPFADYAKDDQDFISHAVDQAKGCLDKQIRDSETRLKLQ